MEGVTQPIFSTLPHRNLLDGVKDLQALILSVFLSSTLSLPNG